MVHVTVIRATTGTPRPFNDFYPLANVLYVRAKFLPRMCTCGCLLYVCVCVGSCALVYPPHTRGTVIISSLGEISRVQPLPNSASVSVLAGARRAAESRRLFAHSRRIRRRDRVALYRSPHDESCTSERCTMIQPGLVSSQAGRVGRVW